MLDLDVFDQPLFSIGGVDVAGLLRHNRSVQRPVV
jgi:hypothetical protein